MLASWLVRPTAETAGLLPLLTGLAVAAAIRQATGAQIGLKWPNDVLAVGHEERKLAGILAEATTTPNFAVVIGCGVNVAFGSERPEGEGVWAIDVAALTDRGTAPEPLDLLRAVLAEFHVLYTAHEAGDLGWIERYRDECVSLGRTVRMDTASGVVEGRTVDIDSGGGLIIDRKDGTGTVVVTAGDAHHIGPPAG